MVRRSRDDAVATRERILASAQQLMHQRGVHCVTLEDVARAIGMTRGAVYAHFRSRAALLGALLSCAEADLAERLAPMGPIGAGEAPAALEPGLAALLDGDGIARHVSLLAFLLQHKCGADCGCARCGRACCGTSMRCATRWRPGCRRPRWLGCWLRICGAC